MFSLISLRIARVGRRALIVSSGACSLTGWQVSRKPRAQRYSAGSYSISSCADDTVSVSMFKSIHPSNSPFPKPKGDDQSRSTTYIAQCLACSVGRALGARALQTAPELRVFLSRFRRAAKTLLYCQVVERRLTVATRTKRHFASAPVSVCRLVAFSSGRTGLWALPHAVASSVFSGIPVSY
ncbi:hypothetical protein B0H14DRAFT_1106510 [Mycena olivaceomarginata]|nr:hypothetical protein B0H14DRAFT_1106510 [Mycena olivaceomarginata]